MDELSPAGPGRVEEARVEAFLAPLGELSPASRARGRRRARARVVRLAVIAAVLVGLGAGIAVAEEMNDQSMFTIVDTNGNVTTAPLVPAPPPQECIDGPCSPPGADQKGKEAHGTERPERPAHSGQPGPHN